MPEDGARPDSEIKGHGATRLHCTTELPALDFEGGPYLAFTDHSETFARAPTRMKVSADGGVLYGVLCKPSPANFVIMNNGQLVGTIVLCT